MGSDGGIEEWGYTYGLELGSGSMGVVRLVQCCTDGQEYACKHVRSVDQEHIIALRREYELMNRLDHANVVRAKAFYECRNNAWLCMEWCRGGSLETLVQTRGPFQEPQALSLAVQLLTGVDYLHCRRVVHRDIKPANLVLDEECSCLKLGDLGSAREVGCSADGLAMLSERGTQLYYAPELRFGLEWNERVDIWAAGLCVFVMLEGILPFDVSSRKSTKQLRTGTLPAIAWGSISRSTRNFVRQSLTVEMRDRPTALELTRHPVFAQLRGEEGRQGRIHQSKWLPSCGWLIGHPGSTFRHPRSPSPPPAVQREEQRALSRLVERRYARTEGRAMSAYRVQESPL